jgi:hypothetical protein
MYTDTARTAGAVALTVTATAEPQVFTVALPATAASDRYLKHLIPTASGTTPDVDDDIIFSAVVGAVGTVAFATAADLATRLGRTFTATETAQAEALLLDASAAIREELRQQITPGTSTITLLGNGSRWLDLPQRPVTAVATVLIEGSAVTDYELVGDRLYRAAGWLSSSSTGTTAPTVTVTVSHGYATTPPVIVSVCLRAAARAMSNPVGMVREQIDDYAIQLANGAGGVHLDEADLRVLRRYKRSSFTIGVFG